jgi:hypothetical protein
MSKKPTTNESRSTAGLQICLNSHTSSAGLSNLCFAPFVDASAQFTFQTLKNHRIEWHVWNPRRIFDLVKFTKHVPVRLWSEASEQPRSPTFLRDSLLWIGSRDCSHKNGIFDWVVVFVSFNIKRKKISNHYKIVFEDENLT